MLKDKINRYDDILQGITFDDLITACQCNLREVTAETIKQQFEEMLQANIEDARYIINEQINYITGEI